VVGQRNFPWWALTKLYATPLYMNQRVTTILVKVEVTDSSNLSGKNAD
jgi:hypothetical protein